jgi:regulator of protease activity HflC (stomatin/prohibitin superfamily)
MDPLIIGGGALVVLLLLFVLFRLMWRVAEPNEALVISGLRQHAEVEGVGESLGFKIVTGKGTLVLPGIQTVRRLSLDLREAQLGIDCVSTQGIPLAIQGVVIFKVGDDYVSIANAARRFLDQQNQMDARVHNVFAGHLRAIVGNMTVEEMIRDREKLTSLTRESSGTEMEKLGLIVDSLQIQEIHDPTGYIKNLALPHAAAVSREARIAQAHADREATQAEQQAEALKAEARRDSHIKQAGYQAQVDRAAAEAKQAGPLADASARQDVVVQETRVARPPPPGPRPPTAGGRAPGRGERAAGPLGGAGRGRAGPARGVGQRRGSQAGRPGRGRRDLGQGPRRGRCRAGPRPGRGRCHQGARRRARAEPGRGHRPATRGELAGDRGGRRQAVRRGRPDDRPERGAGAL